MENEIDIILGFFVRKIIQKYFTLQVKNIWPCIDIARAPLWRGSEKWKTLIISFFSFMVNSPLLMTASRNSHTHIDYLHNSCQPSMRCEASSTLISGHIGEASPQALFSYQGCIMIGRSISFKEMLTPTSKMWPGPLVMNMAITVVHSICTEAWSLGY